MPLTVSEPLNPDKWSVSEQQAIYDELYTLLGKPPPDYSGMTDAELSAALHLVLDEIKTRPTATVKACESIDFEGDSIVTEV